jgi:glycerophosphoryl diester phosphodiesterase
MTNLQIVGHRGAAGVAPENTLPSFEAAWAAGVAWVETDVHLTRDGVPILLHDATLDRTTTGHGPVSGVTWEELQSVDAGVRFSPAFAGTRIPRLEELLAAATGRSGVLIELKAEAERAKLLVQQVLEAVATARAEQWVRLISFEAELLERVGQAAQAQDIATGFIASEAPGLLDTALRLGCVAIHPRLTALSATLIEAARAAGLRVNTWTANTPEQVHRAAALGVDEITTDIPTMGQNALGLSG